MLRIVTQKLPLNRVQGPSTNIYNGALQNYPVISSTKTIKQKIWLGDARQNIHYNIRPDRQSLRKMEFLIFNENKTGITMLNNYLEYVTNYQHSTKKFRRRKRIQDRKVSPEIIMSVSDGIMLNPLLL